MSLTRLILVILVVNFRSTFQTVFRMKMFNISWTRMLFSKFLDIPCLQGEMTISVRENEIILKGMGGNMVYKQVNPGLLVQSQPSPVLPSRFLSMTVKTDPTDDDWLFLV